MRNRDDFVLQTYLQFGKQCSFPNAVMIITYFLTPTELLNG